MTEIQCYGCGIKKDPCALEAHDVPESQLYCTDVDVPTLHVMDCQGWGEYEGVWKSIVVCNHCFDRLDPDMWISSDCWGKLDPAIPFEELPDLCGHEMDWNIEKIEQERLRGKPE